MRPPEPLLTFSSASEFAAWLARHHATERVAWLVFRKVGAGGRTFSYAEALDEALCWGWIDSIVRRLDEARYAQKFTPRSDPRRWSAMNVGKVRRLIADGRMQPAGLACLAPEVLCSVEGAASPSARPTTVPVPAELAEGLVASAAAHATWDGLPPSCRREYARWVGEAKRPETRRRRAAESLERLAAGKRLGMK
jgi:uncharacterized protein YdeI (YjbR/CyaY-like superfamily)